MCKCKTRFYVWLSGTLCIKQSVACVLCTFKFKVVVFGCQVGGYRPKYKEADIYNGKLVYILGQSRHGKATILKGVTWLSGMIIIGAGVLSMLVAALVILFLIWTLCVDYFHRNVK